MIWTPEECVLLGELIKDPSLTWPARAARFPGRTTDQVRMKARHLTAGGGSHFTEKPLVYPRPGATTDELVRASPITLDDLLVATAVDLDVWEVERWIANKWEVGTKLAEDIPADVAGGFITKERVVTTPLYQIKAWFKKKSVTQRTVEELRKGLLEDIRAEQAGPTPRPQYKKTPAPYLFEFAPFDLHLGKLCWGDETVTNYDGEAAESLFNASLEFLLEKALRLSNGKLERILCVFGNDAMHVDSKRMQTTAGTPMDFDSRYIKMYRRLIVIHRRAVEILRQIAPVDIVIVPGNHDELTSFHMGEILATRYEDVPGVSVDNGPSLRKYYEYGVNAFGFTHGDAEKVSELPLLMARERPDMWARCPSREWHIGHKHISEKWEANRRPMLEQDLVSDKGIRIRRLTSLSAHDAWHTKHAYTDRRACEAFLFHKEAGFTDHISFNVDHFTGKALSV
jgi:hypothetical protein